jgi:gliding motility-associated-like protein
MVKQLLRYLPFFILSLIFTNAYAQFPYTESFRFPTANGIVFGGAPSAFLTASGSSATGGTPFDLTGNGYLRLTNATTNQKGYAYSTANFPSSNGLKVQFDYAIYGGSGADGISFFLFDATANPFTIGGFGGSLGYAQITTTNPVSPGVSKGYLAIGLDEFGNFSNPNEGRQGGPAQIPGSVTLRGKGDGSALTPDNYKFLVTKQTDLLGVSLVGDPTKRISDTTQTGYRKVSIELIPNALGGYNVNVYLTKGGIPQTKSKIIDNYYYPEVAPTNLRYGFASSTGNSTNFHEIRNVSIDLYNPKPVAIADAVNVCSGINAVIDVTANDVGSTETVSIDKATIDLNPALVGIQKTLIVAGQGTFSVDANALVTFVPFAANFLGTVSAQYTFINSLGFVSNAAAITITYSTPPTSATAGADQFIKNNATTTSTALQGSNPGVNTGLWTQVTGPNTAVFSNTAAFNSTVANLVGGVYVFRWTVSSPGGCSLFDDVQITIAQAPVANDDAARTPFNTAVIIPILSNDTYSGTATLNRSKVQIVASAANGTVQVSPTGELTYTPNSGFEGIDQLTYTITDINGVVSNIATVTITVLPEPSDAPDIVNGTTAGKPVTIPVVIPPGGTINIIRQPEHGTLTIDPTTGQPIYTPDPNYSGQDSFTYTIIDVNGNSSRNPGTVTIFVQQPAKIGLAKSLVSNTKNTDGSYTINYLFTAVNSGDIAVEKLSLTDDLSLTFSGSLITINRLNASGTLSVNPNYNGTTVKDILLNTSNLDAKAKETVTLEIRVILTDKDGIFYNTAVLEGVSTSDGSKIADTSTNGLNPDPFVTGDVTPKDPTPATLIKNPLFIPHGFSPNNDGIHDLFTIENANGRQILLEVFNRWGNRIYRSKDYQNNWNGKTTEGIHVGDEVPVGTYYYVVVVDNKEKYVGYITINR